MRRFSPEYLRDTRRGLWEDRESLAPLELSSHDRILDVGCGTGELSRVLQEESAATVVGIDADRALLEHAEGADELVQGDAVRLPFADDAFDLVVCQALLINLPDPLAAVREFARVSGDLVAAIEPDNSQVRIESTVDSEARLADRARSQYIRGVETDVSLGPAVSDRFRTVGLESVETIRHPLRRAVQPPYSAADVESAKRKARGTRIDEQRRTLRSGGLTQAEVDALQDDWQAMGRAVVEQMAAGEYERESVVPFFVTVGRVP
ncbi:SAM-dependent methyltransferase [Halanaeroarchaeum sp. HSR-CO]|uniref:class I SAM-dependent methyltransferase n=1 Tax=Halanaeroarchaeum sp. HSR-CO TaxID=2866382 RepID=UPI00217D7923|nr:methyltransferase domain-containing protein [Halanaeroarchaeum sp. HSR-CO]UWG47156.1 SAM-dependent methyltransferase [Halanaeroarchaeum sp. HSR-CO]